MTPAGKRPYLSVHGTGVVSAKPDVAIIQVGVQIQNESLDAAQSEAATKMDAIINQLKDAGVKEKDISTSQYNVQPMMAYRENQAPRVTGYQVTNIVGARLRELDRAGKIIDSLVGAGANALHGISFGFSDSSALVRQAREEAMKDARDKAEQLARLGGVKLGPPVAIEEGGANVPPTPVPVAKFAMMAASDASTPINPGQQEVRADVSVTYKIK